MKKCLKDQLYGRNYYKRINSLISYLSHSHTKMRRKQYRERNKQLHRQLNSSQQSGFISYSSNLRKKQEEQMRVLEKIDYNSQGMAVKKNDNEMFLFMKQKGREERGEDKGKENGDEGKGDERKQTLGKAIRGGNSERKGTVGGMQKSSQNYQRIDTSAVVIKGRLIYLKQQSKQSSVSPSNDHFLTLLRQNNITPKQFLTQDQEKIRERMKENQSIKENDIIKDYILRNMSEQSNGEVVVMERFHEVKGVLFD